MAYYAHTSENPDGSRDPDRRRWSLLADHLEGVADRAEGHALQCLKLAARWCGLLHDLGKYREEFQEYLAGEREGSVETHHAMYGAALAFQRGWLGPAFAVAGHHAGLHDRHDLQELVKGEKYDAMNRLEPLVERFEAELEPIPIELAEPAFAKCEDKAISEFYVRMLFSCLVDADFLDTENFAKGGSRSPEAFDAEVLLKRLHRHCDGFDSRGELNGLRNRVFQSCLSAATEPPGFFSLTVPTGGGKTLSGMAFALEHARRHGLRRVVVVIPYLSIIEQNAAEYRKVLDPENEGIVIEHHSAVAGKEDADEQGRSPEELAAENWDAPIIVTTSVQFIESLFANRSTKCRKLHNLANSVVVLDEVQTLPTHLLNPLLHVLRDLREHYGVSFVFSTATQPAFKRSNSLSQGFEESEVREIVTDTGELFHKLNRVQYEIRKTESDWVDLAGEWKDEPQALGVVNTRRQAYDWWSQLRSDRAEGVLHLSSALCADHRAEVLAEAHRRLQAGEPCRLVATQVIEAGVDIDFPLVYRAMGPLDSIVQAAGRCNREGRLGGKGRVVVFCPVDHKLPGGVYRVATEIAARLLSQTHPEDLASSPDLFASYFNELFQYVSTDYAGQRECPIQEDRERLRFRVVARKARVITDHTEAVIAPRQKALEIVEAIRERDTASGKRFTRHDMRDLQRFMVNLQPRDFQRLDVLGLLRPLLPGMDLRVLDEAAYHEHLGVIIESRPSEDFLS